MRFFEVKMLAEQVLYSTYMPARLELKIYKLLILFGIYGDKAEIRTLNNSL